MADRVPLSVVISNYNRRRELRRTLESVRALDPAPLECIVVDNHSLDGSAQMVRAEFPQVRLLSLSRNRAIGAVNVGIRASRGDYVLCLDNDMTLEGRGAFERAVAAFESNTALGAVALRIVEPDGRTSPNSPKHDPADGSDGDGYPAAVFDGGAVAFRRSALERTALYPEDFVLYHNEWVLAAALWDADFEVRYFPGIVAVHHHAPTARVQERVRRLWWRNYLRAAWRTLPAADAVKETVAYMLIQGTSAARSTDFKTWCVATLAAFTLLPADIRLRRPVRAGTARRMAAIRRSHERAAGIAGPFRSGRLRGAVWKWYLGPPAENEG